jgi:hypothetical protein
MEMILIIGLLVLLFGGGGYWGSQSRFSVTERVPTLK